MATHATVVVVGAGGNIGSHLIPHLARMAEIGRLILVDRDVYEARNRWNQDAPRRAAGLGKAAVQAERARRVHPGLRVDARRADVETMPMGALRADLILSALDSRRARQAVNQAAWRLGVPWIDAGVQGDGLLVRVTRYAPAEDTPCLECGWDQADYAALEQTYPCTGTAQAPPTAAPSSLGALAAALLAIECHKQLTRSATPLGTGASLVLDASHLRHYVTAARRNPGCRLGRHAPWPIEPHRGLDRPLDEFLELGRTRLGGEPSLAVPGQPFIRQMRCAGCGRLRRPWRLAGRLAPGGRRCPGCGAALAAAGFDQTEHLTAAQLPARVRARPLASFGLQRGDVVRLATEHAEAHFELAQP
jgi:molybdopterin/thiamine biosynthesis adenylyltransferase